MKYNRYPVNFVGITTKFSTSHRAIDLGWKDTQNMPIYAVNDGVVFDIGRSTGSGNAGNYVWIKWSDGVNDWYSRFAHLKDNSILVKVGQNVSRGQQIATMGGTYGYEVHLHYDLWKCPLGYVFNWSDRAKYAVNPTKYTYLFENQTAGESLPLLTKVLGTSKQVKRDITKNQIEVIGYQLRVRKGAGTNQTILGYIDFGIYDYSEIKEANNYIWYNVGFGWIAGTKEDTKVYTKEEKKEPIEDEKDKIIIACQKELKKLNTSLNEQKQVIEEQKKEIDQLQASMKKYANLTKFSANGEVYIKLKSNDTIYF